VPVANRYFGVFQSGEIKCRGIELRRHDTPKFIADTQYEMLELLAKISPDSHFMDALPALRSLLNQRLAALRTGAIPLKDLIVRQNLSRELAEYHSPSPAAIAAGELASIGKYLRPGQPVRLIFTRGKTTVHSWDGRHRIDPLSVDTRRYAALLKRAASTILEPIQPGALEAWQQIPLPQPRQPVLSRDLSR